MAVEGMTPEARRALVKACMDPAYDEAVDVLSDADLAEIPEDTLLHKPGEVLQWVGDIRQANNVAKFNAERQPRIERERRVRAFLVHVFGCPADGSGDFVDVHISRFVEPPDVAVYTVRYKLRANYTLGCKVPANARPFSVMAAVSYAAARSELGEVTYEARRSYGVVDEQTKTAIFASGNRFESFWYSVHAAIGIPPAVLRGINSSFTTRVLLDKPRETQANE